MGKFSILFFFILLLSTVFAQVEYEDIGDSGLIDRDEDLTQAQDYAKEQSHLSQKLDLSIAQNAQFIEVAVHYLEARLEETKSILIVTTIITILAHLGIWWAVYLYLKSRKLI